MDDFLVWKIPEEIRPLIRHETKVTKEMLHQNKTLIMMALQLIYNKE